MGNGGELSDLPVHTLLPTAYLDSDILRSPFKATISD